MADDIVGRLAEWQRPILQAIINGENPIMVDGEKLKLNESRMKKMWLRHWWEARRD